MSATSPDAQTEPLRSGGGKGTRWAVHLIALAAILAALVAAGRPGVPYFVDEGGLWFQLDARLDGQWGTPYDFEDLDPDWRFRPLARASRTDAGMAQYLRHPLHLVIAQPFFAAGSHLGLLALSILGVVGVAGVSAGIAQRVRPSAALATFWIIGLASPITFHSHLWIGHPLAALGSAGAIYGLIRVLEGDGRWIATVSLGAALAAAVRSEGLLVGPAIAGGVGVVWLLRRVSFSLAWRIWLAAAIPPALVLLAERWFVEQVAGTIGPTVQLASRSSALLASINAAFITLLSSSYADYVAGWLLVASPVVVYVLAKRAGRLQHAGPLVVALGLVGVLLVWRLFAGDPFPIPGVLVAFPLGVASIALLTRSDIDRNEVLTPLVAAALLAVVVLGTQYEDGGGFEWGWRYFAVGIPMLVPAIAVAAGKAKTWQRSRTLALSAALLTAVALGVSLYSVRWFHTLHSDIRDDLAGFVSGQGLDRPLVIAVGNGLALMPGVFVDEYDQYQWLSAEGGDVVEVAEFLQTTSFGEFVVLRPSPRGDHPGEPWRVVRESQGPPGMEFIHYRR